MSYTQLYCQYCRVFGCRFLPADASCHRHGHNAGGTGSQCFPLKLVLPFLLDTASALRPASRVPGCIIYSCPWIVVCYVTRMGVMVCDGAVTDVVQLACMAASRVSFGRICVATGSRLDVFGARLWVTVLRSGSHLCKSFRLQSEVWWRLRNPPVRSAAGAPPRMHKPLGLPWGLCDSSVRPLGC